jgi:hypothetical protein
MQLDHLTTQHNNINIITLSLDIIIDPTYGNLINETTINFWVDKIHKRQVHALIAGPPCETWSVARFNQQPNLTTQPQPLRNSTQLFGTYNLNKQQLTQTQVANQLLLSTLHLTVHLFHAGGAAILEHPKQPQLPHAPSIWKIPLINYLLTSPAFNKITFKQNIHGQIGPKPTTLLTLRIPNAHKFIYRRDPTITINNTPLIGRNSDGTYKTTKAKEYPPHMCKMLALMLLDAFSQSNNLHNQHQIQPTTEELDFLQQIQHMNQPFDPYSTEQQMGADYAHYNTNNTNDKNK